MLELATKKFKEIGLTINTAKCKCALDESVKFMGITFYNDSTTGLPAVESLANTVKGKCLETINKYEEMMKAEVPKHMIYNFVKYCLIPSTNYAPFLDNVDAKDTYKNIDMSISILMRKIMDNIPSVEEVYQSMNELVQAGGF